MKIICEYCDSYIEPEGNSAVCPCCGGPIGSTLREALEKEREAQRLREQEEEKRLKEAREDEQTERILNTVASVAASGLLGSGVTRLLRKRMFGAGSIPGGGSFLWNALSGKHRRR